MQHTDTIPCATELRLVRAAISTPNAALPAVALAVERRTLAKRLWRGTASDGADFGFQLEAPLRHGDTFFETSQSRYVIAQQPEALLEIALDTGACAAAGIGWAIGNLHVELSGDRTRLLTPDEPAVRQLLDRLQVPYCQIQDVFRPGRFTRGDKAAHEVGPSHRH